GISPGTPLAFDGEVTDAGPNLRLDKLHEGLRVYRPLTL
ncbi:MAG: phosphoesterase, partial [Streptomyces albidoflavus]